MRPPKPPTYRTPLYAATQGLAAMACRIFFNVQLRGKSNIPPTGGALIVSNHQSYLDPIVLSSQMTRKMSFLASAHLFQFKPFGWYIRALSAYPIQQGKGDIGAVKQMIQLLQAGEIMNVFPEGSRSEDGKLQPIQGGVVLAIRRAKVPVVPAIVVGAYEAWNRHRLIPRPGRVRVIYRPPVELHHLSGAEITDYLQKTFVEMFAEAKAWRDEAVKREG
ncbi:MAG TPA: lysophospholipid acyltransferase family protein [Tepidisphaeraceae bacterium]